MRLGRAVAAVWIVAVLAIPGCVRRIAVDPARNLDAEADDYVRLVLAVGRHDPNYVDAYHGPPEWKERAAQGEPVPSSDLLASARTLRERVRRAPDSERRRFLESQLTAVEGFLRILQGERLAFDREARDLYDIDPPPLSLEALEVVRREIDVLLPGDGDVASRLEAFRRRFEIPRDRLAAVADACLSELRARTATRVDLPAGESFRLEFVSGRSWGAYNWYQGDSRSVIQINTDLPFQLGSFLGLLAHEGYPGHHVFNAIQEAALARGLGWREFSVSPLYSPASVIAEGTADNALDMIMGDRERMAFVRRRLAPLAGLSDLDFDLAERVREAAVPLRVARGAAARMLLEQGKTEDEVTAFLTRYGLMTEERARKAVAFARTYRAYEFAYVVGEDLVRGHIGTGAGRFRRYFDLFRRPVTPSSLKGAARRPESDAREES